MVFWVLKQHDILRVEKFTIVRKNNFFGMKEEQLIIFEQRTIPAFDMNVRSFYFLMMNNLSIYFIYMNEILLFQSNPFLFSGQIYNGAKIEVGSIPRWNPWFDLSCNFVFFSSKNIAPPFGSIGFGVWITIATLLMLMLLWYKFLDGNGGLYWALREEGVLADLEFRDVR